MFSKVLLLYLTKSFSGKMMTAFFVVCTKKKECGIRMAVDYRVVNQFLRVSANQLPYQDMLFQQLAGQIIMLK